jgi:hypothetical protein
MLGEVEEGVREVQGPRGYLVPVHALLHVVHEEFGRDAERGERALEAGDERGLPGTGREPRVEHAAVPEDRDKQLELLRLAADGDGAALVGRARGSVPVGPDASDLSLEMCPLFNR